MTKLCRNAFGTLFDVFGHKFRLMSGKFLIGERFSGWRGLGGGGWLQRAAHFYRFQNQLRTLF